MNAIYILWLRQLKRFLRNKSRIIGSLGQPLLFLVALGFGLGPVFQQAGQGNYISFLAPGIIAMSILFTGLFAGIEIIWDRQFGFLKETLVAPISRYNIMIGRTIGGATIAIIQGVIVFGITLIAGFDSLSAINIPMALAFMFLIGLLFTALGTAIASVMEDMQGFQLIMNFLIMPLLFLSGAFFPLDNIPSALRIIVNLDPLTYGIDGLRGSVIGLSYYGVGFDFLVLSILTAVLLIIGARLFSKIQI